MCILPHWNRLILPPPTNIMNTLTSTWGDSKLSRSQFPFLQKLYFDTVLLPAGNVQHLLTDWLTDWLKTCIITDSFHWCGSSSLFQIKVKVKVKLSLCLTKAPHHEDVLGEWRYSSTHSLTSALDGDELSASCSGCFTPRERAPGTYWIGSWVGPTASLDTMLKKKISSSPSGIEPQTSNHPAHSQSLYQLSYPSSSLFQTELISLWISEHNALPPAWISSARTWSILYLFSISTAISTFKQLKSSINGSAVCISVCITSLMSYTFNSQQMKFFHLFKILWESSSRSPSHLLLS
jgi:hypothetical protein